MELRERVRWAADQTDWSAWDPIRAVLAGALGWWIAGKTLTEVGPAIVVGVVTALLAGCGKFLHSFIVVPREAAESERDEALERAAEAEAELERAVRQRLEIAAEADMKVTPGGVGVERAFIIRVRNTGAPADFHANLTVLEGSAQFRVDPQPIYRLLWEERDALEIRLPNGGADWVRFGYKTMAMGRSQGEAYDSVQLNWGVYRYNTRREEMEQAGDQLYQSLAGDVVAEGDPLIVEVSISTDPLPTDGESWRGRFRLSREGCERLPPPEEDGERE